MLHLPRSDYEWLIGYLNKEMEQEGKIDDFYTMMVDLRPSTAIPEENPPHSFEVLPLAEMLATLVSLTKEEVDEGGIKLQIDSLIEELFTP